MQNYLDENFIRKEIALSRDDLRPAIPADEVFASLDASILQIETQLALQYAGTHAVLNLSNF